MKFKLFNFKNHPLSVQLSIIFTVFILLFVLFFTMIFSRSLTISAKKDLFLLLEHSETTKLKSDANSIFSFFLPRVDSSNIIKVREFLKNSKIDYSIIQSGKNVIQKDSIRVFDKVVSNRFDGVGYSYILDNDITIRPLISSNTISTEELSDFVSTIKTQFDSLENEESKNFYYSFGSGSNKSVLYYRLSKFDQTFNDMVLDLAAEKLDNESYKEFQDSFKAKLAMRPQNYNGLITYSWDYTANALVNDMIRNIIPFTLVGSVLAIALGIFLSRRLSKPLKNLQKEVQKIGERDWNTPLKTDRKDEIGQLTLSLEQMREQLTKAHEQEQWMLQKISHELKTPVMIIRSYAQAANDGIYPKGTLKDSIDTIDKEALRLDSRIKELLYLTKLNYLTKQKVEKVPIELDLIIESVINSFEAKRGDIKLNSSLVDGRILGISEQLKVVFENLIDNSLRYARSEVSIKMKSYNNQLCVEIYNDGDNIPESIMENLFEPFFKGSKGNYGLGLAIAKNIVDIHEGSISVQNKENGVSFCIRIDLTK